MDRATTKFDKKGWVAIGLLTFLFAFAIRYPFYAFLFHFSQKRGVEPWMQNYMTWCTWDCAHYARLTIDYGLRDKDICFFPGLPWLAHGLRLVLPISEQAAVLAVSNFFTFVSLMLTVWLGAALRFGREFREKFPWDAGPWVLGALVGLFPASHFFSSGYPEAIFLALLVAGFFLMLLDRWALAAFFIGLLGVVRNQGVWVAGIFTLMTAFEMIRARRISRELATQFILGAAPTGLFMLWQWIGVGDPLYFIHVLQSAQWRRSFSVSDVVFYHKPKYDLSWVLLMLSWFAGIRFILRGSRAWRFLGIVTLVLAVLPLGVGGFASGYWRYMATNLGIFVLLSELFSTRSWIYLPWLGWSIFRLAVEVDGWTVGLWRG